MIINIFIVFIRVFWFFRF